MMHTTARYTNMIEEAKCRVEAQLQLIGKRISEYQYHLAHNKSVAEQTDLMVGATRQNNKEDRSAHRLEAHDQRRKTPNSR